MLFAGMTVALFSDEHGAHVGIIIDQALNTYIHPSNIRLHFASTCIQLLIDGIDRNIVCWAIHG